MQNNPENSFSFREVRRFPALADTGVALVAQSEYANAAYTDLDEINQEVSRGICAGKNDGDYVPDTEVYLDDRLYSGVAASANLTFQKRVADESTSPQSFAEACGIFVRYCPEAETDSKSVVDIPDQEYTSAQLARLRSLEDFRPFGSQVANLGIFMDEHGLIDIPYRVYNQIIENVPYDGLMMADVLRTELEPSRISDDLLVNFVVDAEAENIQKALAWRAAIAQYYQTLFKITESESLEKIGPAGPEVVRRRVGRYFIELVDSLVYDALIPKTGVLGNDGKGTETAAGQRNYRKATIGISLESRTEQLPHFVVHEGVHAASCMTFKISSERSNQDGWGLAVQQGRDLSLSKEDGRLPGELIEGITEKSTREVVGHIPKTESSVTDDYERYIEQFLAIEQKHPKATDFFRSVSLRGIKDETELQRLRRFYELCKLT